MSATPTWLWISGKRRGETGSIPAARKVCARSNQPTSVFFSFFSSTNRPSRPKQLTRTTQRRKEKERHLFWPHVLAADRKTTEFSERNPHTNENIERERKNGVKSNGRRTGEGEDRGGEGVYRPRNLPASRSIKYKMGTGEPARAN